VFKQLFQVYSHLFADDGVSHIIYDFAAMLDENKINNRLFSITISKDISFDKKKWSNVNDLEKHITPDTLVIFHFAMPTPLSFLISEIDCPKVLLYHNITPPVFLKKYNHDMQSILASGLRELIFMALHFSYAWGVSEYNCSQLREAGYARTSVANPPFNFNRFSSIKYSGNIVKQNNIKEILFVGRISPNKRQEDIIKAFYYYHRLNPNSKLTLIGSYENFQNYKKDLEQLSAELNVPVTITGGVPIEELTTYYKNADLFLCMSEHEGFCIPLIEAMYFGVPVIAFDSSAVPETVGNAGIIFKQKHFPSVAHLMNEVLNDISLQKKMGDAGRERAEYFSKEIASKRIIRLIENYACELGI